MSGTPQGYPPQQGGYPQQPQGNYPPQQGGHPQQPYGQQGYGPTLKPDRGGMLIAFSILSWFVCIVFGIVAFVMAKNDMQEMQQGIMSRQGEGLTKAAYYISLVHFIFFAVVIVLYIVIFVVVLGTGAAG